jgi:myo-inositol-1(or 4)-monophosphatase
MIDFIKKLAHEAGRAALDFRTRLGDIGVEKKSPKDFVSEADKRIEEIICERIKQSFPHHSIFGEESGVWQGNDERWIIDPIDGTTSFIRGHAYFSISIAYEKAGVVQVGAVYAPALDEFFTAQKGQGAELNGAAISCSSTSVLGESLLATGFACLRSGRERHNMPYLNALLPRILDMRRMGSAALDLSYVACGRLDGFWELNLNDYDIAAGKLILEEAGGRVSDFNDHPMQDCSEILASNTIIHEQLSTIMKTVEQI